MKLKFTIHFQDKILDQGINIDHVKKAIKNPDAYFSSFHNRCIVIKSIEGRKILIVYIKEAKNVFKIITGYYIDKI